MTSTGLIPPYRPAFRGPTTLAQCSAMKDMAQIPTRGSLQMMKAPLVSPDPLRKGCIGRNGAQSTGCQQWSGIRLEGVGRTVQSGYGQS